MHSLRFGERKVGEFYHIFNRGNNKRETFLDVQDIEQFVSLLEKKNTDKNTKKSLVSIISFSILNNHFHLLARQEQEGGIQTFMHRIGIAYTMYFNKKYDTTGSLFQGKYKFVLVPLDQLQSKIVYVNCNHKIHNLQPVFKNTSGIVCLKEKQEIFQVKESLNYFDSIKHLEKYAESEILHIQHQRNQSLLSKNEL